MNPILSVHNLCAGYGQGEVLHNISFAVDKNDYIALAGPNGAGKTTLVKTLLGLMDRYTGTAEIFGRDIRGYEAVGPYRVPAPEGECL